MKLLFSILILTFLSFNQIHSQCCAAGNPVCTDNNPNGGKKILNISALYLYSFSDTYFEGRQKSDFTYKHTLYDFSLFSISYGISKRLSIKSEIGYFLNKSEYFVLSNITRYAHGVSDAAISTRYDVLSFPKQKINIGSSFMIKIPVGVFDQVQNNILLPIDLQPSSGSFRYTPGLSFNKKFKNPNISLTLSTSVEYAQAIQTERTINYKYGNLYLFSAMGSYKINKWLGFTLQAREMIREKASNNGYVMHATGGNVLFIVPQLNCFYKKWQLSLMFDKPVYRNLNSPNYPQLSNKYAISFNLSYALDLKANKYKAPKYLNSDVQEQSFFVDGICGMCKDRIQKIAYKSKNIRFVDWSLDKKMLTIKYKDEIDLIKLKTDLAYAGHDTDEIKAPDNIYDELHHCCKYRK